MMIKYGVQPVHYSQCYVDHNCDFNLRSFLSVTCIVKNISASDEHVILCGGKIFRQYQTFYAFVLCRVNHVVCCVLQHFIDSLRVFVRAGTGGQGLAKYNGIGGRGGDIVVIGQEKSTLNNVKNLFPSKRFSANQGEDSRYA